MRILLICLLILFSFGTVHAVDTPDEETQKQIQDLEGQIDKYTKKIDELKNRAGSLASEVEYMDSQISLTELRIQSSSSKISATYVQITKLEKEIDDLKNRIDHLEDSISYQRVLLNSRSRERYKNIESNPIVILFGSSTLSNIIRKSEYLKLIELQDNKLLDEMEKTKKSYNIQKGLFETKKEEEVALKVKLEQEKASLDSYKAQLNNQKEEKASLLRSTQNDEAKYQDLLAKAKAELEGYKSFVSYAGGGEIGANEFGRGSEGWYYSQRDSRWADVKIGKSSEKIFDVGCLLTSVAMVYRSYGYSVTPDTIARDTSRFWYNTALMTVPWKGPSGRTYTSISRANIQYEIKNNPVIVGVSAGPYGTHFLVLSKKDGDDYIMYDPWYGPDLKFSKYYNFDSIFQAVVFK